MDACLDCERIFSHTDAIEKIGELMIVIVVIVKKMRKVMP